MLGACGWAGGWVPVGRVLWEQHGDRFGGAARRRKALPPPKPDMWRDLRSAGHVAAASRLDAAADHGELTDVDYVRVTRVIRQAQGDDDRLAAAAAEIEDAGAHAWLHASGQRDLPARLGEHDLMTGQVRLGVASRTGKNPATHAGQTFALDAEVLRTSLLVIGPPGSGKSRSFARPIVELLGLQTLTNMASVVVIDPRGDYALPGFFDVDIDPGNPESPWGFDLYGGARNPAEAADRLAGALLPPGVEPEADAAAHNALDAALSWFRERESRYPTLRELIAELDQGGPRLLVERLRLLDRPALVDLFDGPPDRRFSMREIDKPLRVRIALPEGAHPQAARILARLAVSQFVQTVSAPDVDRSIFKGLVVDDAGRFVDEYVVQGLQRARAANAGLILLAQSMREFPEDLRATVFANTGCKAVFAGIDPQDAAYIADFWGKQWVPETTVTTGQEHTTRSGTITGPPERRRSAQSLGRNTKRPGQLLALTGGSSVAHQRSVSTRPVERYVWSPSEIINEIPTGHALISLATADGFRTPPVLVDLRG
ncbi:helicase HerA domain-containing protein [Catenulispora yoronensis]